ncbi:MAG TPA: hypothetical protein VKT21_02995, partial [Thermoplasmata archaeon]|nr:hypothetical protein [Thermoplasmata archaeon]
MARASWAAGAGPHSTTQSAPSWSQITAGPSGEEPYMAYDPAASAVLVWEGLLGSSTNSTWLYSNGSFTQLHEAVGPPDLMGAAMAYDPANQSVILFGGLTASYGYENQTWIFSNLRWSELNSTPVHTPPARVFPALDYDPSVGGLLLFGGTTEHWVNYSCPGQNFNDTWEFVGGLWTFLGGPSLGAPPARFGASMAFDPTLNATVLFGGGPWDCTQNTTLPMNDTWTFSGGTWHLYSTSQAPSARLGAGLAFAADRSELVLFGAGGYLGSYAFYCSACVSLNDTWVLGSGSWLRQNLHSPPWTYVGSPLVEWTNGTLLEFGNPMWQFAQGNWSLAAPPWPAAGTYPLMVYDAQDGYVLLLNEEGINYQVSTTWTFQNGLWTNITAQQRERPTLGYSVAAADDLADGYVLLFNGDQNATWKFSGGFWTKLSPTRSPPDLSGESMTYDAADGFVLLFGGTDCQPVSWSIYCQWYNDTWSYSGGAWTELVSSGGRLPAGRSFAGLDFDPALGAVVLFGGVHCDKGLPDCTALNDTWTF